jgi:hypothetical protein
MSYTCQNCGVAADDSKSLCNPIREELQGTFCGLSAAPVCEDKLEAMKFSCDSCGRVSPDSEHLCNPVEIR